MRVLLTNRSLANLAGSELYLRDVAVALSRRGHQPLVYSPRHGPLAESLRSRAIPVVSDLDLLAEPPDLIHGQHHVQAMAALLRFPGVPAIYVCHGWLPWVEQPPRFPRILRYVAVDRLRRERLVSEEGVAPDRVEILPNFVDFDRFRSRRDPLPARPRRALVFSNQAAPGTGFAETVRTACRQEGIEVELVGLRAGRALERPEDVLPEFDLVFARGRCALEAMASGAAVVLCDHEGLGPMVTSDRVQELADLNFGIGAFTGDHDLDTLRREIRRFDARDARAVSDWVRENAGLEEGIDRLVDLYERVLAEWRSVPSLRRTDGEGAAASSYLAGIEAVIERSGARLVRAEEELGRARNAADEARERSRADAESLATAEAERRKLRRELDELRDTAAFRLRAWLLRRPTLAAVYRLLAGAGGRSSS